MKLSSGNVLVLCFVCVLLVTKINCWDLAVTSGEEIEFLHANGSAAGKTNVQFRELSALDFDPVRRRLFVTDTANKHTIVFSVSLSANRQHQEAVPVVAAVEDHTIQDIAYDPVDNILYWTDMKQRRIEYINVSDGKAQKQTLFAFKDEIPKGIVIDSCGRYLYWTNGNHRNPSIERSLLGTKKSEIIITDELFKPSGITIDHDSRKIYWADDSEGNKYKIERANLDGTNRETLIRQVDQVPFRISVGFGRIFWIDWTEKSIWTVPIQNASENVPQKLHDFKSRSAMGIISKNYDFMQREECMNLLKFMNAHNEPTKDDDELTNDKSTNAYIESTTDIYRNVLPISNTVLCLNGATLTEGVCICASGFTGDQCEINMCHNYCVQGDCFLSSTGYPECRCLPGYRGQRCEIDSCEGFCLNGGRCSLDEDSGESEAICKCEGDYEGYRCEQKIDADTLCRVYCEKGDVARFTMQRRGITSVCRCSSSDHYSLINDVGNNSTSLRLITSPAITPDGTFVSRLGDPVDLGLFIACAVLFTSCLALATALCWSRKRRPRIKKRFIVNKPSNVTPLTCRPLQGPTLPHDQCEITIENCCNMNICETPCFEPPQLRSGRPSKTEEKKTLLASMENGDELY